MFDSMAEALKKHIHKIKTLHSGDAMEPGEGTKAEELQDKKEGPGALEATDRAPSLHGTDSTKVHGDNAVDGDGVEEQMKADPMADHHASGMHPARSGGGLSPEEHQKIMHALTSVGPVGRGAMTLGERAGAKAKSKAQEAAIHAKAKDKSY